MNVEKMLIKCQFEQWLYDEAQLLDDIEFDDWFDLMHSSLRYQMPVRVNKEGWNARIIQRTCLHLMMILSCLNCAWIV